MNEVKKDEPKAAPPLAEDVRPTDRPKTERIHAHLQDGEGYSGTILDIVLDG